MLCVAPGSSINNCFSTLFGGEHTKVPSGMQNRENSSIVNWRFLLRFSFSVSLPSNRGSFNSSYSFVNLKVDQSRTFWCLSKFCNVSWPLAIALWNSMGHFLLISEESFQKASLAISINITNFHIDSAVTHQTQSGPSLKCSSTSHRSLQQDLKS